MMVNFFYLNVKILDLHNIYSFDLNNFNINNSENS